MNLLDVRFPKKIASWLPSFDSKKNPIRRGAEAENVEKVLFCINHLWTENIKNFDSSQNHFGAKRFRVKKPSWNIYKSPPSDTRVLENIGTLFCTEEISPKKWSVLLLRYQQKETFRRNCYLGKEFFLGKQLEKKQTND